MQQQLQIINEVVVDYKAKIDLDVLGQLEEVNARRKKFLLHAIVERKNMKTCTLKLSLKDPEKMKPQSENAGHDAYVMARR